jgi:hypothetical protein
MKSSTFRKIAAASLLGMGILLQLLAPENWIGLMIMGLAVFIEFIGFALKRGVGKRYP